MIQVAYPIEFPLDEIQQCIRIAAGKTILQEKELFAIAAWNIQGFAQKMLIGPPDRLPQARVALTGLDKQHLKTLQAGLITVDRAGDAPQSLPLWLEMLVKILLQAITELLGD